ncbi:MAG TPA: PKD domain-containing protein, partial [Saprospiraceae bacterium]|nr:PKD domain-containing protein [Saprospiraceae bacterium]
SGCIPLEINFTDLSSSNATNWQWSFPGSLTPNSTEQNPTVTYDTPGFYNVELIVGNAAGNDTISYPTYIMAESTPIASFEPNISGRMLSFETNIAGADSVLWDFGDGNRSTNFNPTHIYSTDGVFNVSLQATNHCGTIELAKEVKIITPPISGFSANVIEGCSPLTVEFTDLSSANVAEWTWIFPGGTPDSSKLQNPVIVYEEAGNYSVVLQVKNDAGKNTTIETSYIMVAPGPVASFLPKQDGFTFNMMNTSQNADSFFWDFGDSNTSTELAPTHTYAAEGEYLIMLIAESTDCGRDTSIEKVTVLGPNSVVLLDFLNDFRLFPNPNQGQFTLLLDGREKEQLEFTMFDILGQVIHQESLDFSTGHLQKVFNFSSLAQGTYLVQLRSGDGIVYKKVVVEGGR